MMGWWVFHAGAQPVRNHLTLGKSSLPNGQMICLPRNQNEPQNLSKEASDLSCSTSRNTWLDSIIEKLLS